MFDWDAGTYETTAEELAPVSEHVIALAAPGPGTRLLDVACGTGNAALVAARRGATVAGVDSAGRLVEVARDRAAAEGLEADFIVGDAQDLPFDDAMFDLVVSVFGLIFAPDPDATVAEAMRVLHPGGEALVTVWVPAGGIDAAVGAMMRAVASVTGGLPRRFAWSDESAVRELAGRNGAAATFEDAALVITAESPEAYMRDTMQNHPMQVALGPLLQRAGTYEETAERVLEALREHNEDAAAFKVTSPYRVVRLRHAG